MASLKLACGDCSLHPVCLPRGIEPEEMAELDRIIRQRRPLKRGEHLFRVGDPFESLYVVRSGSVKTYAPVSDGSEQITGFLLPGEMLGLDAISRGHHPCGARTLETASVCEIPFEALEGLGGRIPALHHQIYRLMSRELLQEEGHLLLLGRRGADERLASYLLNFSDRLNRRGFSAHEFYLSMSRGDIGNYLGMAVETVSRTFTRFQERSLLTVERKHVYIHDREGLEALAGGVALETASPKVDRGQ
ncbi:MAG: fumarate/nitrate reduction transcriptional regulator Fnr [Pseudomonadota bacterium]